MKKRTLGWILLFLFIIHPFIYIEAWVYASALFISFGLAAFSFLLAYLIGSED